MGNGTCSWYEHAQLEAIWNYIGRELSIIQTVILQSISSLCKIILFYTTGNVRTVAFPIPLHMLHCTQPALQTWVRSKTSEITSPVLYRSTKRRMVESLRRIPLYKKRGHQCWTKYIFGTFILCRSVVLIYVSVEVEKYSIEKFMFSFIYHDKL